MFLLSVFSSEGLLSLLSYAHDAVFGHFLPPMKVPCAVYSYLPSLPAPPPPASTRELSVHRGLLFLDLACKLHQTWVRP